MDAAEAIERARDRWACRGEGVPLRVRACLRTPLGCDDLSRLQALDSALEWAALLDAAGPPSEIAWPAATGLLPSPLASVTLAGWDVACCARGRAPGMREGVRKRRRRPHAESYGIAGKVLTNGGPYKALDIPVLTVTAPYVEWAVRGDEARLRALLARVHGLGRDAGAGMGAVLHWTVEATERDESLVRDGVPARALPVASCAEAIGRYGDAVEIDEVPVRGPYWHRLNRTLAALPPC